MSESDERRALQRWAETWARAGAALDEIKRGELRTLETSMALDQLSDAFDHALRHAEPMPSSGLVTQQQLFARLRR